MACDLAGYQPAPPVLARPEAERLFADSLAGIRRRNSERKYLVISPGDPIPTTRRRRSHWAAERGGRDWLPRIRFLVPGSIREKAVPMARHIGGDRADWST